MLTVVNSSKYKRDTKSLRKQGKDVQKLVTVLEKLVNQIPLDIKYKDHALQGQFNGCRECHIEPDWLLIYYIDIETSELYLLRTGSHAKLFEACSSNDSPFYELGVRLAKLMG